MGAPLAVPSGAFSFFVRTKMKLKLNRWIGWWALAGSAALTACGGGETAAEATPTTVAGGLRAHVLQLNASAGTVTAAEAARQLMDFGERTFPNYFPRHQATQVFGPYLYRYYAETGNYLAVYNGHVYVTGTAFGADLVDVGALSQFITPVAGATATLTSPSTGKAAWRVAKAAQVELRDASGNVISGALSCSSDEPVALSVAADCSSITGQRLGSHSITVSSGATNAKVSVKVVPAAQPLGQQANADALQMVVTVDGRVLAWGHNINGVLGQGKSTSELASLAVPTPVKSADGAGSLQGIMSVSVGAGVALAVTEDGEVYSWGSSFHEQLGRTLPNSNLDFASLPGKVQGTTGTGSLNHIVAVSIGDGNAMALADDGTVYTWGAYAGHDNTTTFRKVPGIPSGLQVTGSWGPAVAISAGWNWNSALMADGRVLSWGFRNTGGGNLGRADASTNYVPGPVVTADTGAMLTNIVSLSAGYMHSLAVDSSGRVWAWGDRTSGQLGGGVNSSTSSFATLVRAVDGGPTLSNIAMVAAGGNHSLALDKSGNVYSWGLATSGELGDGPNRSAGNGRNLPAPVAGATGILSLNSVVAIAAGHNGSTALRSDGTLMGWGTVSFGALAQGSTTVTGLSAVPLAALGETGSGTLMLTPVSFWPNLSRTAR